MLGGTARTRDEAIDEAGQLLVATGAVDPAYVESMHDREKSVSTYVGNSLAIPHGTNEAKQSIRTPGCRSSATPSGIDWNGEQLAHFVVGIAGAGDDHLTLLSRIAETFVDEAAVARLRAASRPDDVLAVLERRPGLTSGGRTGWTVTGTPFNAAFPADVQPLGVGQVVDRDARDGRPHGCIPGAADLVAVAVRDDTTPGITSSTELTSTSTEPTRELTRTTEPSSRPRSARSLGCMSRWCRGLPRVNRSVLCSQELQSRWCRRPMSSSSPVATAGVPSSASATRSRSATQQVGRQVDPLVVGL